MVITLALLAGLALTAHGQPAGEKPDKECCDTKTVGGVTYSLIGQMDTKMYNCLSDCIYMKEGQEGGKFCFAMGDLQVECNDEEMEGSEKPPMEGSEKPPMGGSEMPPMEGSEMPPMEGSEMPPMEGSEKPPMEGSEKPPMEGSEKPPVGEGASAAPGSDDEVVTRVKGYIDAGTCNTVTFPTEYSDTLCGDNAVSYYKEFLYNDKRVIISNNIPDHPAETDAISINPNLRCTGWQYLVIPVDPAKGSTMTDTGLGTIGLAVTGGAFFNDLSNPDGSLAMPNEGASLDSCLGHSAPTGGMGGGGPGGAGGPPGGPGGRPPPGGGPPGGPPGGRVKRQEDTPHVGQYHYHGNLNCTDAGAATGANDASKCLLIGYYRDGVPVYGFCKDKDGMMMTSCYKTSATLTTVVTASGTYQTASSNSDYTFSPDANCNLDEASGAEHPSTGQYSYFMTTDYPWIPVKFAGDQGSEARPCSAD